MTDKLLLALSQLGLNDTLLKSLPAQPTEEGWTLDSSLLDAGLLSEESLLEALSEATQLKPVNLNHFYPDFSLAKLLLPEWCQQHACVPLCEEDEALHVAVAYPPKLEALEAFSLRVGRKLLPWIAIECRIQQWLATLYGLAISKRTFHLLEKLSQTKPPDSPPEEPSPENLQESKPPPQLSPAEPSAPPLPLELNIPAPHSSNVFKDFFVKVKQQFWAKPKPPPETTQIKTETPTPTEIPTPTETEIPTAAPTEIPAATPTETAPSPPPPPAFFAVDEGPFAQNLFEEFLANIPPPRPLEKSKPPEAKPPQKESPPQDVLYTPPSFQNSMEAAPLWTLEEAKAQLRLAQKNRDGLTSVLLRFGLCCFEFVGLFSVVQGKAQGFSCAGKGAQEGFLRTKMELSPPGIFYSTSQTTSAYFGPPPQEPRLQRFLADIQRRPRSIFIYPIAVGDKLVAIFYGDSGQNSLQQKQFADFTLFCQQLPDAFHELLWVRRQQTLPTSTLDETALKERIAHAITQLFETDAATQNTAREILGQTPQASANALAQLFPGPHSTLLNEDESLPPLHTLGPIPHALLQLGEAGAQALKPLLSSADKNLRCAALKLAGIFASPQLLEPVALALSHTDSHVASSARTALPHFKSLREWPHALLLIQHSLNVRDPLRRTLAAKAVVAAKDKGSIETLIKWTGDVDAWVAETAAWALQKLSCIHLGPSPNLWQRWWSRAQHERRVEWLVCALESESFEQRKQAIDELSCTVGDSFHFRADASEEERSLAVQCWKQFVAQNPNFEV